MSDKEVCLEGMSERLKLGIWICREKSVRNKWIHFPQQGIRVEVPKQMTIHPMALIVAVWLFRSKEWCFGDLNMFAKGVESLQYSFDV